MNYQDFITRKSQGGSNSGFKPVFMPDYLFDFQKNLVEWAIHKGRALIGADCGLGKTVQQLVWAENVVRHTNKRVLILTPLAVSQQTHDEATKFGIEATVCNDGKPASSIVITNYEKLHHFAANDYVAVVCDESSILKSVSGATRIQLTRFMSKMPYRLLCTATAAPNDWVELGTSSEALGELSHSDMLRRFFRQLDDKGQKRDQKLQDEAVRLIGHDPEYFGKLAFRVAQTIGQWRLKNHAVEHFWRWVASWARACRKPSDLGFSDDGFVLPKLTVNDHIIKTAEPPPGMLFNMPAIGLGEERDERRRTMSDRCEYAARLVKHKDPAVIWCHMNSEGDMLEEMIGDGKQISGSMEDDERVELYEAFRSGQLRVLIIKPRIGAYGLNWQHCNHVVSFATHSYEQDYQSVRRCWRFGQKRPVRQDVIATEGEARVLANMRRKGEQADKMFTVLVKEMQNAVRIERANIYQKKLEHPSWLLPIKS